MLMQCGEKTAGLNIKCMGYNFRVIAIMSNIINISCHLRSLAFLKEGFLYLKMNFCCKLICEFACVHNVQKNVFSSICFSGFLITVIFPQSADTVQI